MNQVVIILVLYNETLAQTPSYSSLKQLVKETDAIHLFVYDNSLVSQEDELFSFERVTYVHNPENPGLATAYTVAEQYLIAQEADLLLLLDQDTTVPKAYIDQLLTLAIEPEVGAYVPIIHSQKQQLSPVFVEGKQRKSRALPTAGVYTERLMAINSGTVIPRQVLQKMGSFNSAFPLDFLDHWFFWWLHQEKKKSLCYIITWNMNCLCLIIIQLVKCAMNQFFVLKLGFIQSMTNNSESLIKNTYCYELQNNFY